MCSIYVDVRLAPDADALAIKESLGQVVKNCGVEGTVELYTFRKGQIAQNVEPLTEAIEVAHTALGVQKPGMAAPAYTSMWRDHLVLSRPVFRH